MKNEGFVSVFLVYGVYGLRKTRRQIPKYLSFGGLLDSNRHQDTKLKAHRPDHSGRGRQRGRQMSFTVCTFWRGQKKTRSYRTKFFSLCQASESKTDPGTPAQMCNAPLFKKVLVFCPRHRPGSAFTL